MDSLFRVNIKINAYIEVQATSMAEALLQAEDEIGTIQFENTHIGYKEVFTEDVEIVNVEAPSDFEEDEDEE
jgi:hypothetical protein